MSESPTRKLAVRPYFLILHLAHNVTPQEASVVAEHATDVEAKDISVRNVVHPRPPTANEPPYPIYLFIDCLTTDILWKVSLAQCVLVQSDAPCSPYYLMDCLPVPNVYRLHTTLFVSDRRPHHLILVFPSVTIRAGYFSSIWLTRYGFQSSATEARMPIRKSRRLSKRS